MNFLKKCLLCVLIISLSVFVPLNVSAKSTNESEYKKVYISKDTYIYTKDVGNRKSNITVLFLPGYGDGISYDVDGTKYEFWGQFQNDLSKNCVRSIAFDPLGIGQSSDIGNLPDLTQDQINLYLNNQAFGFNTSTVLKSKMLDGKTSYNRALQALELLKKLNVKGNVILVPHSISAFTADFIINKINENPHKYKFKVAGVLNVDGTWPTNPKDITSFLNKNYPEMTDTFLGQFSKSGGTLSEIIMSASILENSTKTYNIPMTLLHSVDQNNLPELQELSDQKAAFWLNRYNNSNTKEILVNSSHYIMLDQPDIITQELRNMIELTRSCFNCKIH